MYRKSKRIKKPKSNRQKFSDSNKRAVEYLHNNGYNHVLLRTHCRHHDQCYASPQFRYECMDYWNMWDGMCFDIDGHLWFIQIKTDAFPSSSKITEWMKDKTGISCMAINVSEQEIRVRIFKSETSTL